MGNSVALHAQTPVDAFRDFGHDVAFEDARRQIGKGCDQLLPVFLDRAETETRGDPNQRQTRL